MKTPEALSEDARLASASWTTSVTFRFWPAVGVPQTTRGAAARLAVSV